MLPIVEGRGWRNEVRPLAAWPTTHRRGPACRRLGFRQLGERLRRGRRKGRILSAGTGSAADYSSGHRVFHDWTQAPLPRRHDARRATDAQAEQVVRGYTRPVTL